MSSLIVEIAKIDGIDRHPNADRLDLALVKGWQCVVQKDSFKVGDKCLYIPIDSVLPHEVEDKIFGPDSKVKLTHSRVKTIKLRGAISQGLVVGADVFGFEHAPVGLDVAEQLGIKKYEPPVHMGPSSNTKEVDRSHLNPNFHKYTDIENFKNYPKVFDADDIVAVTEKVHGTNFRCGWVPYHANTIWQKFLKLIGLAPKHEFVYGSHNRQLQNRWRRGIQKSNVYLETVEKYDLKNKLRPGEVLYGEIYGDGIQKGYSYGCDAGERKLVVFDIMEDGRYLSHTSLIMTCAERNLPLVPTVKVGLFGDMNVKELSTGPSLLDPNQNVREGVVVRCRHFDDRCYIGRKVLKVISDEYLLKDQTDFH